MRKLFPLVVIMLTLSACSPKMTSRALNAYTTVQTTNVSYNPMTMVLDSEPITYTIDISTQSGRAKLKGLSLDEAYDLVLVEAVIANKCATIFQPQYTNLMKKGNVLRVTVYGYPARYKAQQ